MPVAGAVRHGARPPRLAPAPRSPGVALAPRAWDRRAATATAGADAGSAGRPRRRVDARAPQPAAARSIPAIPRDIDTVEVRAGRAVGAPHQPAQAVLARAGHHQGRPPPVLRRRRPRAAAPPARPGDGDERYPHGADGEFFFMKRAPEPAAGVDRDLLHRARVRQRDRLPDDPGPARAAVGGQPRLHRPQPVVRALRRRGPPGLRALRPRPREGHAAGPFARVLRGGAASCATALDALGMPSLSRRPPARAASTSTCPSSAGRRRRRCGSFAKRVRARAWRRCTPQLITAEYRDRAAAARAACSWTTTRTPGDGRWPPSTPCGPHPAGRGLHARHLGGDRGRASRSRTSTCATSPRACAGRATSGRRCSPAPGASVSTGCGDRGRAPPASRGASTQRWRCRTQPPPPPAGNRDRVDSTGAARRAPPSTPRSCASRLRRAVSGHCSPRRAAGTADALPSSADQTSDLVPSASARPGPRREGANTT